VTGAALRGDPEATLGEGWILAVPETQVGELWDAAGAGEPAAVDLPYWNPTLSRYGGQRARCQRRRDRW
jgi:hypothetical protein